MTSPVASILGSGELTGLPQTPALPFSNNSTSASPPPPPPCVKFEFRIFGCGPTGLSQRSTILGYLCMDTHAHTHSNIVVINVYKRFFIFLCKRVFNVFFIFQRFLLKKTLNSQCENNSNLIHLCPKLKTKLLPIKL